MVTTVLRHNIGTAAAAVLLLFPATAGAQAYRADYSADGRAVYYRGRQMEMADPRSFRELGHGYAVDRFNVYLDGTVLEYADPSTFRLKPQHDRREDGPGERDMQDRRGRGSGYFKSSFDVFFNGKKIDGASTHSFEEIGGGYAKDSFRVYYRGKRVEGASTFSFKYLGDGYAEDSFHTYYRGKKLPR